jgi:hypothetical protein
MCLIPNSFLMAEEQQIDGGAGFSFFTAREILWAKK